MIGTQFHPEFLSRPNRPHPLFVGILEAVRDRAGLSKPLVAEILPIEENR